MHKKNLLTIRNPGALLKPCNNENTIQMIYVI